MKDNYTNNSINIGDKNKIKNSNIGNSSYKGDKPAPTRSHWYSKLFWKLFIPISVVVIAAVICFWIGI